MGLEPMSRRQVASAETMEEKSRDFLGRLSSARTFQQLIWAVEAAAEGSGGNSRILNDSGQSVSAQQLLEELVRVEIEEETGDPEDLMAIRQIKPLQRKVLEIRSTRALLNSIYREEHAERQTPDGDEFFTFHGIDRKEFNEHNKLPLPEDATPIIIVPGYSVGSEALRRNAIGIAELGRSVATNVVPPRNKSFDSHFNFPPNTPTLTKIHASALLKAMDAASKEMFQGEKKYDVLGYSYGAINALVAAMIRPEKFRKILLVNPGGLTRINDRHLKPLIPASWQRFAALVWDAHKHKSQVLNEAGKFLTFKERLSMFSRLGEIGDLPDMEHVEKTAALHTEFSAEMDKIKKKGGLRGALEVASAISQADLIPMIQYLTEHGVEIAILPAENDPLFPVEQIEESGKIAGVDVFPLAGAHANVGFSPGAMAEMYIDTFNHLGESPAE